MNLHQYSVTNNIEVGVLFERKFRDISKDTSLDTEAVDYFTEVMEYSEVIYQHQTKQESSFFGLFKRDKIKRVYDGSEAAYKTASYSTPKIFPKTVKKGFCIRTGKEISFNIKVPFSKEAYASWSKWKKTKTLMKSFVIIQVSHPMEKQVLPDPF